MTTATGQRPGKTTGERRLEVKKRHQGQGQGQAEVRDSRRGGLVRPSCG